jgi:RNA polymerase sigma factor (sigma-70 family)
MPPDMNLPGAWGESNSFRFETTHWSVVTLAGKNKSQQSHAALEALCCAYWPPLYAFIRRQGFSDVDAEDLTQEFFARLLERNDFEVVDSRKGKFRTFLLAALTHFLSNQRDRDRAAKRGGGQRLLSIEEIRAEQQHSLEPAHDLTPDKLFDMRWAMKVLENALSSLRREMAEDGKSAHFELLKAYLTDEPAEGDYGQIAEKLCASRQAVAVMVFRLRQRYRELVRAEVAHTVLSPLDVDEEMRYLLGVLSL